MSDTSTNKFTAMGTTAERTAFVPDPGTPTPTPAQGYTFFDTDDSTLYAWNGAAWQPATTGTGDVTASGTLTAGLVVIGDGGTAVDVLAAGSDGDVLTQAGGVATWAAPGASGGLVLLEQHTASTSASLDFTSWYSSTYDEYQIEMVNIVYSGADSPAFRMSTNGGSSYDSGSNYDALLGYALVAGSAGGIGASGTTSMNLRTSGATTLASNGSWNGTFKLMNPAGAVYKALIGQATWYDNSSGIITGHYFGLYKSTTAVDAFRFLLLSGANITSGTIRVYGLVK